MPEISKKTLKRILIAVVGVILLYWLLNASDKAKGIYDTIKSIFSPFVLGAALAFVLNVPMRSFEKLLKFIKSDKFRRIMAIVLTVIVFLMVLAVVFVLLTFAIIDAYDALESRLHNFKFLDAIIVRIETALELDLENIDFQNFGFVEALDLLEQIVGKIGSSLYSIVSGAFTTVGKIGIAVLNFVISIIFALYCLGQKETLARQGRKLLYAFFSEKFADETIRILRLSNKTFSNFLSGQCIEVCILGAMFAVTMTIFRMPFAALISVLIAVTAFIPYIGSFIGCIVGALLILMKNPDHPMQAVIFVIMFLVLQQIEGNLIYPRVVGNSVGLSGMWVLLAIAIGGELFGVVGMFLMIPVVSVCYAILREKTHNRLNKKQIADEKLKPQPPDIQSRFKNDVESKKAVRALRKRLFGKKTKKSDEE